MSNLNKQKISKNLFLIAVLFPVLFSFFLVIDIFFGPDLPDSVAYPLSYLAFSSFIVFPLSLLLFIIAIFLTDKSLLIKFFVTSIIVCILIFLTLLFVPRGHPKDPDSRKIADMKQVQLALELFHDANGSYPSSLDKLFPEFIENDLPLKNIYYYQRHDDSYKISIKFDRIDDFKKGLLKNDLDPTNDIYDVGP
jgi:hypothetical protein